MAVLEAVIADIDREMLRVRGRLHDLESDRATLRLLMEQLKVLGEKIAEVANGMELVAKRTARETVQEVLNQREGVGRARWALRASWVAVGISVGGFVSAVVFGVIH